MTTGNPIYPTYPSYPVGPNPNPPTYYSTISYWPVESLNHDEKVRIEALKLAVEFVKSRDQADGSAVVRIARRFERYITTPEGTET